MIHNTDELKQYISVAKNFTFSEFEPYLKRANREFLQKYVGKLYEEIEDLSIDADVKDNVRDLVNTSIANFAYYLSTPFNSITIDDSGMANVTNQNRSNLTMAQMNDVRRELLRSAHSAMDALLEVLEDNADLFTDWKTNYYTEYKQLIVNSTKAFQKGYNIHNSRQTFLALQPSLSVSEDRLLQTTFCAELIARLKESNLTDQEKHLKHLLSNAIVMATVAKVYNEGVYEITSSGIKIKFDTLPYEHNQVAPFNEQMRNKVDTLTANAEQYIIMAIEYIQQNLSSFTQCSGSPIKEKSTGKYQPIITASVIGL